MTKEKGRVGTLGPDGSNSATAARNWCKKTGRSVSSLKYYLDISDIVVATKAGEIDFGIIPIQNMWQGPVADTLDFLAEHQVKIYDEMYIKIKHCLLVKNKEIPIVTILSHPQALAQCRKTLKICYPGIELLSTTSTSAAAANASETDGVAAIASCKAAEKFGLTVLDEHIQDKEENYTRFVVISNYESSPTGNDKTSFVVCPRQNIPGVLYKILGEFAERGIDLMMVETRPDQYGDIFGQYIFHIDSKGHRKDPLLKEALSSISKGGHWIIDLGSYPITEPKAEV